MSLHLCHGPNNSEDGFECSHPGCGYQSEHLDEFAMSTCWPCSGIGGGNPYCTTCVRELGVGVSRFRSNGKYHRMVRWVNQHAVRTACGTTIRWAEAGDGSAVLEWCARCWPEVTS